MKRIIVLSIFLVLFVVYLYAQGQSTSAPQVTFKYCLVTFDRYVSFKYNYHIIIDGVDIESGDTESFMQPATKLGAEGWEMISVIEESRYSSMYFKKAILK
jgi:hypothetical protein